MILNAHPEISCPSEHQLEVLRQALNQLLHYYNQVLERADQLTGKQGPSLYTEEDFENIFAYMVMLAALRGAKTKNKNLRKIKWFGLNDNAAILKLPFYAKLFPEARFVCIVRDPRSVAISSWYHNLRTEPDFVRNRGKNLDYWAAQSANFWIREYKAARDFQKQHPEKIIFIRYEDLVLDPLPHYQKLFSFLEVNTQQEILEKVIEVTRFDRFKDGKFFRKASIDDWKKELSLKAIQAIEKTTEPLFSFFGYKPFQP